MTIRGDNAADRGQKQYNGPGGNVKSTFRVRSTKCHQILQALWDGQWHSNAELAETCLRYGARIFELRRNGIDIETDRSRGAFCQFRLLTPREQIDYMNCAVRPGVPVSMKQSELFGGAA